MKLRRLQKALCCKHPQSMYLYMRTYIFMCILSVYTLPIRMCHAEFPSPPTALRSHHKCSSLCVPALPLFFFVLPSPLSPLLFLLIHLIFTVFRLHHHSTHPLPVHFLLSSPLCVRTHTVGVRARARLLILLVSSRWICGVRAAHELLRVRYGLRRSAGVGHIAHKHY